MTRSTFEVLFKLLQHEGSNGGNFLVKLRDYVASNVGVSYPRSFPSATSAPGGIGTSADEGCLCHGEKNSDTAIIVTGLPDFFESNTTYNFSTRVDFRKYSDEESCRRVFAMISAE